MEGSLKEARNRTPLIIPAPVRRDGTEDEQAVDKHHHDLEMAQYKSDISEWFKNMIGFRKQCGNYYNTILGQLSQTVIQRLEALEEYDDIQTTRDLGKLFVALDQVVLGDRQP